MSTDESLKELDSHFQFGKNWAKFSTVIDQERLNEAVNSLKRLLGDDDLSGKTFLDIGCGSGLFSAAAALLGAKRIVSIDIDPDSVETTKKTMQVIVPSADSKVEVASVFKLDEQDLGIFDVVYSWGVLHHTGGMYDAIKSAMRMVKKDGLFVFALYRKTKLCKFWKLEKRLYTRSPGFIQRIIKYGYISLLLLRQLVMGVNPVTYVKSYKNTNRGMSCSYDAHDWLGGYPYESISPGEVHDFLKNNNAELVREFTHPSGLGLFGSGCDEYVYRL